MHPMATAPSSLGSTAVISVRRAVGLLRVVADQGSISVTEAAEELGVHKSTASRLLHTLVDEGFLERDPSTRRFLLGTQALRLSATTGAWSTLTQAGHDTLLTLAKATGATTNLGVLSGVEVVHIDQVNDPRSVMSVNWIGRQAPAHATSLGKVLLANAPAELVDRFLTEPLERVTPSTITDPAELRRELSAVRRRGSATSIEEYQVGLNGVAAPVFGREGEAVAAICAYGPTFTIDRNNIERVVQETVAAAEAISRRLGSGPDRI